MPLQDVVVTINVKYPAPRVGLGRPVIFTEKVGEAKYKEYATIEALAADYASGTPEYEKANAIFKQANRPDRVAVATYESSITASLLAFRDKPWHFALIAKDDAAAQLAAATFISERDFKFVVVQVKDDVGREALKNKKRTIIFDHNVPGEHLDAAAVGHLASLPVGSITWKSHELRGITPRELDETTYAPIEEDNANAYVLKGGQGQLSDGKLSNGEWIDVIHGQDWVKADMENEINHILTQSAKFLTKLPYDSRGIGSIAAGAKTTLERGFNNGIIALNDDGSKDYTITTKSRAESDPQDRNERVYSGLSFEFGNAGAIHKVRIQGAILT